MTIAPVHCTLKMKMTRVKTHKIAQLKSKRTIKFVVEFILNSWRFIIMTTDSQPHGAKWPRFYCV